MRSMTLKQYHRERFFRLLEAYGKAKRALHTENGKQAFIALSVQIHAAKADVPKHFWPLVNKA